jgi:hypothetical protein
MTQDEIRQIENYAIAAPLRDVEDVDMLAFLASLIDGHDYLRSKLLSEPDRRKRRDKLDAMRPHLKFRALSCESYELAEAARSCGVQPIYQEQEEVSRIVMPPSIMGAI